MIYLDVHPNISMHKGKYYVIGTKETLQQATEFKDDSLYESGVKYLGESKIIAKTFTLPTKKGKDGYEFICPSKELLDNFYQIEFKIFYNPNYIKDQLYIDRGAELESDSSQTIYVPYIGDNHVRRFS